MVLLALGYETSHSEEQAKENTGVLHFVQDDGSWGGNGKRNTMDEFAYVYILASGFKKLYIGVTNDLQLRIAQHKNKKDSNSHAAKYNINQLVYFERFTSISAAIAREKQLKG